MGIPLPPPWVMMSFILGFAGHVQDFKELASLGVSVVTGRGEDAGCKICDKLVGMILKEADLDEMSDGGGVDCHGLCFNLGKCVETCEKVTSAMANSTGFPCIAAGLCPEVDEFGEVSCKWSYKSMGCEPSNACEYNFPKCELRAGFKKWKKVGRLVSDQLGALDDAFRNRKRCSEPGAGPYCIKDADGLGLAAEWGGLIITFLGGSALSIRAIETPGCDDDRQWLTFWMIFFFFTILERYAAVLLSRTPRYYEAKFVVLMWLMFFEGARRAALAPSCLATLRSPTDIRRSLAVTAIVLRSHTCAAVSNDCRTCDASRTSRPLARKVPIRSIAASARCSSALVASSLTCCPSASS